MAVTNSSDVYQVQQVGQAALDIAFASVPLLAIEGLVVDAGARITDAGGDSITFPFWDTNIADITKDVVRDSRDGVTPSKFSLKSATENAEAKVVSVDGDEYALRDASEDYIEHLGVISGQEFGRVVQASCLRKGLHPTVGTPLVYDIADQLDGDSEPDGNMTVKSILRSGLLWGEKRSGMSGVVMLLHPSQFADLAETPSYEALAASFAGATVRGAESVSDMIVGMVHGTPLVLCESLPTQEGIEINTITRASQVATVKTTAPHGLVSGEKITITGATQTEYNVTGATITVTEPDEFTFAVSGSPATPATGDPEILPRKTAALVGRGAFARFVADNPRTKVIDHAGSSVVTLDTHFRFATHLSRHKPRRLVRVVTR